MVSIDTRLNIHNNPNNFLGCGSMYSSYYVMSLPRDTVVDCIIYTQQSIITSQTCSR
jgi:hypothetical protein